MTLKYYNAYLTIAPSSPQQGYWDDLQAVIDDQFENASNYLIIQKESSTTPNLYTDIGVRLTVPYQLSQRFTIKDDCREILFKSNAVEIALGDRYQFNGFYWLTIDTGRLETPTNSCQIERCNNTLKFYDENGDYNETPCIAQSKSVYDVKMDKYIWIPDGKMRVLVKYDLQGKMIDLDQRFLLNGLPWRCGSRDYVTYIRNGQGYIEFYFASDFISPEDDLVNGVADALTRKAIYSLSILNGSALLADISTPLQVSVSVNKTVNNVSTIVSPTPSIVYSSSDILTATVNLTSGLVTFLQTGSVTITCKLASDLTVLDTLALTGVNTSIDNYTYTLTGSQSPDTSLKLNSIATYVAKRFNNNVEMAGELFDFAVINGSVSVSNYLLTVVDDKSCTLKCLGYPYSVTLRAYLRSDHAVYVDKVVALKGII